MIFDDLHKLCRLCFHNEGENDVTDVPCLLDTIKTSYNIEIKSTDKYTKRICEQCTTKVQAFSWHKRVVETAQSLFADRIQMAEQMNHMKLEPDANTENPIEDELVETDVEMPPDEEKNDSNKNRTSKPKNAEPKENASRIAARRSTMVVELPTKPTNEPKQRDDNEKSKNQPKPSQIRNRRATMVVERFTKPTNEPKQRDDNEKSKNQPKPSQIRNRRATMAAERPSTPKSRSEHQTDKSKTEQTALPIKQRRITMIVDQPSSVENSSKSSRKRRLSEERTQGTSDRSTSRTHSHSGKESGDHKAKKMRTSSSLPSKHTPSKTSLTSDKSRPSNLVKLNAEKRGSNHSKSSHIKKVEKKHNASATPPITQFFAHSKLKCAACSVNLKSQKEMDFHISIHKKGRCTHCHDIIDGNNADAIEKHMISCLYLDNELSADYLSNLLKVKVDLNRLTPDNIEEIRKSLHSATSTTNEPAEKVGYEEETATESTNQAVDQQEPAKSPPIEKTVEKPAEKDKEKEKSTEGERTPSKKPKAKKTPSKPRSSEGRDELMIRGNQSAALMWNDELTKEKHLFMYRNFETDKPVYIPIKAVSASCPGIKALTDERFVRLLQSLRGLKERAKVPEIVRRPPITQMAGTPNVNTPLEIARHANSPARLQNRSPIANGNMRTSPILPTLRPSLTPNLTQTSQSALNSPNSTQTQQLARNSPNLSQAPQLAQNSPNLTQTPQLARNSPNLSKAPQLLEPSNFPRQLNAQMSMSSSRPSNTPNQMNMSATPQVPNTPKRVPFRDRAMSMHMSASEYLPHAPMRRQSICDNNPVGPENMTGGNQNQQQRNPTEPPQLIRPIQVMQPIQPMQSLRPVQPHLLTTLELPHRVSYTQPPPYMTKIHDATYLQNRPQPGSNMPRTNQLKVLTPEDLNLRAVNNSQAGIDGNAIARNNSPNSMENTNNNITNAKKPRTKNVPKRPQLQISDDANVSISISLTRLDTNQVELSLTAPNIGRINYDTLSNKRKGEVRSSLLKDEVWMKMLHYLKNIPPTPDTLRLFGLILPQPYYDTFFNELRKVYPTTATNRSG